MNDFAILVTIYAAVFLSSPLIAVFHELGHALAYLIFTKPDKIDIYIGSYGAKEHTIQFEMGKLKFFIKKSFPFIKGTGLCCSDKSESNYKKYIIILLAGPVFTLFAASVFASIVFTTNASLFAQIFFYIFLSFSVLSLIANLVPRQINSSRIAILQSDGAQIIFSIQVKNDLVYFIEANEFYNDKEYGRAAIRLKKVLNRVPKNRKILRYLIASLIMEKQYKDALFYSSILEKNHELAIHDLITKGYIQSYLGEHHDAVLTFQSALKKDKNNLQILNNIASELIEQRAYAVAQQALDRAFKLIRNLNPFIIQWHIQK